VATVCYMSEIG